MRSAARAVAACVCAAAAVSVCAPAGWAAPEDNPSAKDCLGVERATRNRNGGDREHGAFGPQQVERVHESQPYGRWLNDVWRPANC